MLTQESIQIYDVVTFQNDFRLEERDCRFDWIKKNYCSLKPRARSKIRRELLREIASEMEGIEVPSWKRSLFLLTVEIENNLGGFDEP